MQEASPRECPLSGEHAKVRSWPIVLIRGRVPYVRNQPEAAFKCKRHSLIAPFAGALIPVRTIGLVQQSHCKNTVNYAILSKIR